MDYNYISAQWEYMIAPRSSQPSTSPPLSPSTNVLQVGVHNMFYSHTTGDILFTGAQKG